MYVSTEHVVKQHFLLTIVGQHLKHIKDKNNSNNKENNVFVSLQTIVATTGIVPEIDKEVFKTQCNPWWDRLCQCVDISTLGSGD